MTSSTGTFRRNAWAACIGVGLGLLLIWPGTVPAQDRGNPDGEWRYQSADAWGTRYSPLDQIDASNFEDLEVAWIWRTDNFGPRVDYLSRSTPSYVNGKLYTVAGYSRTVASIDPATGETLWTYREPHTTRWEMSTRQNYGKGVAYAEIDGRGVIYVVSPAFFLTALDAETGQPLENWGEKVPIEGFPESGVVDLLPDLIRDWGRWQSYEGDYDPDRGIPPELGYITNSPPPIVVNGVVVIPTTHEQGYYQTRRENIPGDILAYDARTGEHKWKFHVIPRPGEFGHDTWESDAWRYTGNVSSWAPLSADLERGLVYLPTDGPTIDFYGGFYPGANLFGTSILALDVETGERAWHFQTVHHDLWNYDNPTVPIVVDLTVDGEEVPAVIQNTKQGLIFAFNRETGEPIWPVEERPVPQTVVPGEKTEPTQPFPTNPAPVEPLGLTEDDVIDFTPELKQEALEIMEEFRVGGPYMPPLHQGHDEDVQGWAQCFGGVNITHPPSMDPETGIMYVASGPGCSTLMLQPGENLDDPDDPTTTGVTVSRWVRGRSGPRLQGPQGLPIHKPPYSRITAVDMNTGEHLWWIPVGETPERIANHEALRGVDIGETGGMSEAISMVTGSLLLATEGARAGPPVLRAYDKATGEELGQVELPAPGQYGMMTYMHEGEQYIVVQVAGGEDRLAGSLAALKLP